MEIDPDKVYIYRVDIDRNEAPFEVYRRLAHAALSAAEPALPAQGSIVLKPNATVLYPPEKRIITHPGFVAGLLDALLDKGVERQRLVVAEGQSGEHPHHGHTWKRAGYADMLLERRVPLKVLNGVETRPVEVPGGVVYKEYPIAREVADCAFFFNLPLAKCHNLGCTTLSVKNLMGILTSPVRHLCNVQAVDEPLEEDLWRLTGTGLSLFEDRFCHKLCDLTAALRRLNIPRLCVVDGLVGRDGTAFNEGRNHPLGWALIGENEVHVDAVGTYLMGLEPQATPYLKVAAERGLGRNQVDEIEVVDLAGGGVLDEGTLESLRPPEPLMPVARHEGGYYRRFRADGSVAPWNLRQVNHRRREDGLEPLAAELSGDPGR